MEVLEMVKTMKLGVVLGLLIGTPASNIAYANSYSNIYDPLTYNVVYDLKALYGDSDGDGVLSKEEYEAFDVDSLLTNKDRSFCYLGSNPVDDTHMVFYLYSQSDFSNNESFYLTFNNSMTQKGDGTYEGESIRSSASLSNTYSDGSGLFYKFVINDYVPVSSDGDMRFKPEQFFTAGAQGPTLQKVIDGSELFYNGYGKDAVSTYFSDKVYSINGEVDLLLAAEQQISIEKTFFFIPFDQTTSLVTAKEVPYFFFDFDDKDFQVDDIKSVTWQCYVRTFTQKHYYVDTFGTGTGGSFTPADGFVGIYSGKYDDEQSSLQFLNETKTNVSGSGKEYFVEWKDTVTQVGSDTFYQKTTPAGYTTITQTDTLKGWKKHESIVRQYSLPNIIKMADVDTEFSSDDATGLKEFLKASDHTKYSWAYALQSDDWTRTCEGQQKYEGIYLHYRADQIHSNALFSTTTTCHQPVNSSIVTLSMTVLSQEKTYDISVMHRSKSVRNVYMIGLPAPSIMEFYINDISVALRKYRWLVWVALGVIALLVIGLVVRLFRWVRGGSSRR